MHTSEAGIRLIENFEGFSAYPYNDGVGVMTIGYGTTTADISPLPRYCTREQAEQWLRQKLASKYEPPVNALEVPLNRNQFDALVSLAYNCGPGAMSWQIGRDLKARNYQAAADDFLSYVYAGGRVLQGLVNRRRAERQLFLTPVVDPDPNHYQWYDATPRRHTELGTFNERQVAQRYDELRARQTRIRHPHRAELAKLREQCGILASRLTSVIADTGDGSSYHRRWRRETLLDRYHGQRIA